MLHVDMKRRPTELPVHVLIYRGQFFFNTPLFTIEGFLV